MMQGTLSRLLVRLLLNVDANDLLFVKTINVSIDWVAIKYLISFQRKIYSMIEYLNSMKRKTYSIDKEDKKWLLLFGFFIEY